MKWVHARSLAHLSLSPRLIERERAERKHAALEGSGAPGEEGVETKRIAELQVGF